MRFLLVSALLLLVAGCQTAVREPLGQMEKIEVFVRSGTRPRPGDNMRAADTLLYRFTCEKRVIVCYYFPGDPVEQAINRLSSSVQTWRKLSAAQGTHPLVVLDEIVSTSRDDKVEGGEVHLIFYPDATHIVSMKSTDFSWNKFPGGPFFAPISKETKIKSSDRRIAALDIGCAALLQTTIERNTKNPSAGPGP